VSRDAGNLLQMGSSVTVSNAPFGATPAPPVVVPDRIRRRVALRLLPYSFLLYVVAFLDRVNVSYAALGLPEEPWFNAEVLGFGAGIFFVGYMLLEIPSTVLVERWSARKWMARIMITWGIIASGMGFVHSANQFYVGRFLLGLGEAGFFPGMIVYLGHWFVERDRAKAVAMFYTAVPLSFVIGAPLSSVIMRIDWFGLSGWRWLFILEGIPAVVLGVLNLWLLTDRPRDAQWLAPADRELLQKAIDAEHSQKVSHLNVLGYLSNPTILLLTAVYFLGVCGSYGFGIWLPTMLKQQSGLSNVQVTFLAAVPYVVALAGVVIGAWSSDRSQERVWHTAIPLFITAVGLSLGSIFQLTTLGWTMFGFCIVGAGVYSYIPSFWALPAQYLSGTARAVSVGIINSFGNLGGFAGPYLMGWLQTRTHSFAVGMAVLLFFQVSAGLLVLLLRAKERRK
jgi:MFS transporter, ACS family, tartrate transporter